MSEGKFYAGADENGVKLLLEAYTKAPPAGVIEVTDEAYFRELEAHQGTLRIYDGVLVMVGPEKETVYSTADGQEKEIYENEVTPEGYTNTPRPDHYHTWDGEEWSMTPEALNQAIDDALSVARDTALLVDVTINITGGREVILKNDERTKVNVHFKLTTLAADLSIPTMAYECRNGWFDLNYNDYQEIIWGLDSFTQSVFDALRRVYDTHAATPFTNVQDALTAFEEELDV